MTLRLTCWLTVMDGAALAYRWGGRCALRGFGGWIMDGAYQVYRWALRHAMTARRWS